MATNRIWNLVDANVAAAESIGTQGVAATGSTTPATDAWTVNNTATGNAAGIKTLDVGATVVYNGSAYVDTVTVANTAATSKTTVNGGAGVDTFVIGGTQAGGVTVNGGAGADSLTLATGVATTAIYDSADVVLTGAKGAKLTVDNSAGATAVNWDVSGATGTTLVAAGLYGAGSTAVVDEVVKLIGTSNADTIKGGSVTATTLDGGAGADTLRSGGAATTFIYDAADAIVAGGAGNDTLTAASDTAGITLHMNSNVYSSIETVIGGSGSDDIRGMAGIQSINGGAGVDYIWAGASAAGATVNGGAGADQIWVGLNEGNQTIASTGTEGASDVINLYNISAYDLIGAGKLTTAGVINLSATQTLTMNGAAGNVNATKHFTSAEGWSFDIVFGNNAAAATVNGTANVIDNIVAGFAGSTLDGKGGNDNLYGIAGGTTYNFYQGDTIYNVAASTDTITAATRSQGVQMYLDSTVSAANAATSWNLVGSAYNDEIRGQSSANGTTLVQTLNGGAGNDNLWGGAGNQNADTLIGGAGNDVYYYGLNEGNDVISAGAIETTGNAKDTLNLYNVSLSAVSGSVDAATNNLVLSVVGTTGTGTLTLQGWNVAGAVNKLTDVVISGTSYTLSVDSSNNAVFTAK